MKSVWADGCFDVFHYGHARALWQARSYGDRLVVGIHSNEDISHHKSLPVLLDNERYECVKACRWVDEVVPNAPFLTSLTVVEKYNCNLIMHGDDPITGASGEDCYAEAKKNKIFKEFKRTPTISTTKLVGRMLLRKNELYEVDNKFLDMIEKELALDKKEKNGRIGYICGTFDLYHAGHAHILKEAKKRCDYLILGLYSDRKAKDVEGTYPLLAYKERKLTLLSNKYIDEIIEAPEEINNKFLEDNKIEKLLKGVVKHNENYKDEFKNHNKLVEEIETEFSYLTAKLIAKRIFDNYFLYEQRQKRREENKK